MNTGLIDKIIRDNPVLPASSQLALLREWQERADKSALDKLILSNMRIITKEAYKVKQRNRHLSYSDLVQEGMAGLLKAAEMFDSERETAFLTYAMWWVKVNMRQHVMAYRSVVKLGRSRDDRVLFSNLSKTMKLAGEKGLLGEDKISFVAERLNVKPSSVRSMSGSLRSFDARLDVPIKSSDGSETLNRLDLIQDQSEQDLSDVLFENDNMSVVLAALVDNMPDDERKILKDRFLTESPKTLREVGKEMGLSGEWVRKLELRAIDRLRKRLASEHGIRENLG